MELKKITKIAIFIDYENFYISYRNQFKIKEENIKVWDVLSENLIDYYHKKFIKNDFEVIDHIGSFLCVGFHEFIETDREKQKKRWLQNLDRKPGFIVKYGSRTIPYKDVQGTLHSGREKGVDAEIICQMLMGAFLDHYDSCILLSDDTDYLPAINRVQDYFGKKVIQAGFHTKSRLRNQAYAHIPLERANADLIIKDE